MSKVIEDREGRERVILHCDANSFFASVELIFHPEYRDVPMAVCGSEADRRGIVLAKNMSAKRYGIQTAETVWSARKKCPRLVVLPPHHEEYVRYSHALNEIYRRYTDLVEPFGIDESWLDVTGSRRLFGNGEEIAESIRAAVKQELGLTVSIGVSFNKVFAKLGSDYKKPDAVTVISRENFQELVYPLSASQLLFVGAKTAELLEKNGIRTIGALAAASPVYLEHLLGKQGLQLSSYARGEDQSPVAPYYASRDAKSIGSGSTFSKDLTDFSQVREGLVPLAEDVAVQLRNSRKKCATLCLSVKDEFLRTVTRQRPVSPPTNLARVLIDLSMDIFRTEWPQGMTVRALTVTASHLVHEADAVEQVSFFDEGDSEKRKRRERLEKTMDDIRSKFGRDALDYATTLGIQDKPARAKAKKEASEEQ